MTVSTLTPISPAEVHGILARYILADGFDLVFDFEKSHGAWSTTPAPGASTSTSAPSSRRTPSATTTRR